VNIDDKKKIKIGLVISVTGGLIVAFVTRAYSFLPVLFSWIGNLCSVIWHLLSYPITIAFWIFLLLLILSARTVFSFLKPLIHRKPLESTELDYTEDSFFGMTWRWSYPLSPIPKKIWCFCPKCDTQLVFNEGPFRAAPRFILHCETCKEQIQDFEGSMDYILSKVIRQIDRNIRSGEWKSRIGRGQNREITLEAKDG